MEYPDSRILLFCRAPVAGEVKTRLAATLGPGGAANLHARLVRHTVAMVLGARLCPLEIRVSPDPGHHFFDRWRGREGITLRAQAAGDLGHIMFDAASEALRTAASVLLIGSDCPPLAPIHLAEVLEALVSGSDAVVIPAEDGGYVLLGLSSCDARLFEEIDWGSDRVMAATRHRLAALGWRWRELDALWDVDRPEDLARLEASGFPLRAGAPARSR